MRKNCVLSLVLVLFVSCMFTCNLRMAAAAVGNLSDIDGHWACQEITEMYCSDILSGYPEGVFLPTNSVTRLEVVAMLLRILGLEDQAQSMADATVDYEVPEVLWGRGYLLMGVQQGMLDRDHLVQLRPGEPASRAEVAVLVYHALKLEEGSGPLAFADAADIPEDYQGCVAAVVNANLMQGLPGNVFMPNDDVNRGQMAVLLSRVVASYYGDKKIQDRRYSGTISGINQTNQTSSIISVNNNINLVAAEDCAVFLDGKASSLGRLQTGQYVKMVTDANGLVTFISVTTEEGRTDVDYNSTTGVDYKGKLETINQISDIYWLGIAVLDGNTITRQVEGNLKVDGGKGSGEISSLSRGDYVQIKVNGEKIVEIKIITPDTVNGVITAVRSGSITLRQDNGADVSFDVTNNVIVVKNNATTTYDDLQKDDRVQVSLLDNKVLRIDILGSPSVQGVISEINTSSPAVITIREDSGINRDYVVLSDAEVMQNGSYIRLSNLREGDRVSLELNSKNRVTYIEIVDSYDAVSKLTGEIWDLDSTGTYGITIENDDRDFLEYVVDSDVEVRKDGTYISFKGLSIGDRVKLELDSKDRVYYIEVVADDYDVLEGTITELVTGGSPQMFLQKSSSSNEVRYFFSDRATFNRGGTSLRLRDLVIGSEVEIHLEDGEVKKVEVIDDENITMSGTVTYVNISSRKITVRQLSGNEFTYHLASGAVLRDEDNRTISISDVSEDWDVTLKLSKGEISRLTQD